MYKITFYVSEMKNVILRNLYAVGMHHYGVKEMAVGPVYYCKPEINNHDLQAVAIYQDKDCNRKAGNLRREDARKIRQLFSNDFILDTCYVRAKGSAEKFSRRTGPLQNISIGFRIQDHKKGVLEEMLKKMELVFRVF